MTRIPNYQANQRTPSARVTRVDEQHVGRWRLSRKVGEGPLACVYEARPRDCSPDGPSDYVAKLLRPSREDDPVAVNLMQREAAVGSEVSHPHLVSILAAHVSEAPYYIVMPNLSGEPVDQQFDADDRLSAPTALWIARQVAEALSSLHDAGWVHADVKPANIVVSPEGHATLIDMGFACHIREPNPITDRMFKGTMNYVAPEMFTSTLRTDARSDIYSLGATLYELLTARPPFKGECMADLAEAHLCHVAPNPRRIDPCLSRGVARLLRSMLAKEPLRRPQTAKELVERLVELEIEVFAEHVSM